MCLILWLILLGINTVYDDSVNMNLNTEYMVYLRGSISILVWSIKVNLANKWYKVYILSCGYGVVMS